MASYNHKLLEKKYNNWVKAQLAVLFTKEGIEPFVCNVVQQFQLRCLNDICYNNGLFSGTVCSSCCTENVVKCPTNGICNVNRGPCSYHKKNPTKYLPNGCPNKICHHFKTAIQNVHRYWCPSYNNTDATKWCSNSWEVAKCFMPPDGYKDVACSADTDFNGVISVIINNKDFQPRINDILSNNSKICKEARDIGRTVRHSSSLEVEDTDLQNYFKVFQKLLSDPGYLATDTCAQNAKQKLTDLEKDTLVICKDDIRKVLDDVNKALEKCRTEIDERSGQVRHSLIEAKQHLQNLEKKILEGVKQIKDKTDTSIKFIGTFIDDKAKQAMEELKKGKQENLKAVETKVVEGVKQIDDKGESQIIRMKEKVDKGITKMEDKGKSQIKIMEEKGGTCVTHIQDKGESQVKLIDEQTSVGVRQIKDKIDTSVKIIDDKAKQAMEDLKKGKEDNLKAVDTKVVEGVKQIDDKGESQIIRMKEKVDKGITKMEDKGKSQIERMEEKGGTCVAHIQDKGESQVKLIDEQTSVGVKQIKDYTDTSVKIIGTFIDDKAKQAMEDLKKGKEENLKAVDTKVVEGVKQIDDKGKSQILNMKEKVNKGITKMEDREKSQIKRIEEKGDTCVTHIQDKGESQVKIIDELTSVGVKQIKDKTDTSVKIIDEKTKTIKEDLTNFQETLQEACNANVEEDKEKQYLDDRKILQDELIIWYRKYHSTVLLSPLTEARDTPLANFYVMPDIDMHISYFSEKKETTRIKSLNDLFGSGSNVPQDIYLSADAGFGKTAFSKYLTMLWCQGHQKDENYNSFKEEEISALSAFDFTFLVPLRDSSNDCHLDNIIETQLIKDLPCSKSLPEQFVTKILNKENCLVILDGLDEWSHPNKGCKKPLKCIPHRYARQKNFVILTTTRPWKLGNSIIKTSQIDRIVELVQLDIQSVHKLELNALREMKKDKDQIDEEELKSKQRQLNKVIEDHDLNDLRVVPLILMYIIALWCDGKPITELKCELYTSIIELLFSRTLKKYSELETVPDPPQCELPQCFSNHGNCQKYSTLIIALGELAFHRQFSEKREDSLVFNRSIAVQYLGQEQLELCLRSGILTENKVKKYSEDISKISFSHKTVQEYFTAVNISFQPKRKAVKTITEKCQSLQDILDMKILLVFICGMNPGIISSISKDLMSVVNNDVITCKYRTMTNYDFNYIDPLKDIQSMLISCMKEYQQNEDLNLSLQDVFITQKCQKENYFTQLQHLCHQNKHNIKSLLINNEGICSLKEILNLFELCALQNIDKLCYQGEILEEDMISLLSNSLSCLSMISSKWENNRFVGNYCPLSGVMINPLVKLQYLECLYIDSFTMSHQMMKTLLHFLTSKTSMKEIGLFNLKCSDNTTSCEGFNIDLSQHSDLKCLRLGFIPVSQLNIDVSSLEECDVGELCKPVVESYLNHFTAANQLLTFRCRSLKSTIAITTMLKILPLLVHVKEISLYNIDLGERSFTLPREMVNIDHVALHKVTMSCSVLYDMRNVVNELPHSVTITIRSCDIKPETEFKEFKKSIKTSDKFLVKFDDTGRYGENVFHFNKIMSKQLQTNDR